MAMNRAHVLFRGVRDDSIQTKRQARLSEAQRGAPGSTACWVTTPAIVIGLRPASSVGTMRQRFVTTALEWEAEDEDAAADTESESAGEESGAGGGGADEHEKPQDDTRRAQPRRARSQ